MQIAMDMLDVAHLRTSCGIEALPKHLAMCGSGCKIRSKSVLTRKCRLLRRRPTFMEAVAIMQKAAGGRNDIDFSYTEHADCAERKFEHDFLGTISPISCVSLQSAFRRWSAKRSRAVHSEAVG